MLEDTVRPLSRRRFLALGAGGALVTVGVAGGQSRASAAHTSPRPDAGTRRRVVVVGAGLAGLTAAVDLRKSGWEVVVLEARDRVGGRVFTLRSPFSPGLHAEAGGESIDDNHHDLLALIAHYGLQTERRPSDKLQRAAVYRSGRRSVLSRYIRHGGAQALNDYFTFLSKLVGLVDGIDFDHPERFRRAAELDGRSLADFLAQQHFAPGNELLITDQFRGSYNADLDRLSLLFVAWQEAKDSGLPLGGVETMRISGGNDGLPRALAAELEPQIRLSSPVSRVEHRPDGVRVHAGGRPLDAAWLVLATPPPPLRHVVFSPSLTGSVTAMIGGLSLGPAVKVITEYRTRFWEPERLSGFMVTDLPFGVGWAATDSYVSTRGLLTQFITGSPARHAATLDDDIRTVWAQRQLDEVFPEGRSKRDRHHASVAWPDERYTGGGYAAFAPGQLTPFWPVLRSGFGPVRFAGEHTETLIGYMESAVRSGHRVAAGIGVPPG